MLSKTQTAKATKQQEVQGIEVTRNDTHKNKLDLKYLKQVRDEEHKNT